MKPPVNCAMRRPFLKFLAASALGAVLPTARAAVPTTGVADPGRFDALTLPAILSSKASGLAMLALVRAGKRMVAAGERGTVLLSDDDGKTWRQALVPLSVTLTAMHFIDARQGWAVGHLGVVLRTVDGGEHWAVQLDGRQAARIALESAKRFEDGTTLSAAQALVEDGPDKPFLDVYFENERTGYVVGAFNFAFRTDDGGKTWNSLMYRLENPKGAHLYAIRRVGQNLFIAGEQGLLLRSSDGQRFVAIAPPSKGTYFGLVAGQGGELLVYGLRGRAFLSTDAGNTWAEVETGTRASLSAGLLLDDGRFLLASQSGELLVSREGGKAFRVINSAALPVTALLQAANGRLALATLRGIRNVGLASAS